MQTRFQLLRITNSNLYHRQLKQELTSFENKQLEYISSLTNCTRDYDIRSLTLRQKENRLKELEIEFTEAQSRIDHAKTARAQEIEGLKQKTSDAEEAQKSLQVQLDQSFDKMGQLNTDIRSLTEKVADCEYRSEERSLPQVSPSEGVSKVYEETVSEEYYFQPPSLRGWKFS